MEHFIELIEKLQPEHIDYVLNAVIQRMRELYPDWEIIYYAQKKGEPVDTDRIRQLLGQKAGK